MLPKWLRWRPLRSKMHSRIGGTSKERARRVTAAADRVCAISGVLQKGIYRAPVTREGLPVPLQIGGGRCSYAIVPLGGRLWRVVQI